jgi:hypothetical protein
MLPERLRRFIASLICAFSVGVMLLASLTVCAALENNFEAMFGSWHRAPALTRWFYQWLPKSGGVFLFGFLSCVVGYGCLAWIHRVSAFHTMFHAMMGFFAAAVWTSSLPLIQIYTGLKESESPVSWSALWFERAKAIPWLVFCLAPLVMAALSWRKRTQTIDPSTKP